MPPPSPRTQGWASTMGHGCIHIECFLDMMCPFSEKFWKSWISEIWPEVKGSVKITVYHYCQPWHFQSSMANMAAISVKQVSPDKYFEFLTNLFNKRAELTDQFVADMSYADFLKDITPIATSLGVPEDRFHPKMTLASADHSDVMQEIKFHTKYGRQNGIHVTPSFMVNGIVDSSISSAWKMEEWKEHVDFIMGQKIPVA
ncbi:unnamed protein product [Vitrella brassicaformis CCMP3155]|uniref:Thioredoxin-like fold domain-containing protein n=1 Tax=Vitrella brassicaformis (strain CCMP3155) TaxID=1169540 RepID=A0A0G4G7E6_VITBC|nr:unnamed protein product [Vitrella brassicaformis CCMP3155]|mmetsp:Transcript_10347/g.25022  ORF Transcript_10347/g.25022 Transcript_10347/m.25022 type:complete len:201 (-) Transcript_10347:1877-2479(-)|eukprot:CEM24266.1 unnamed protein product [Vitrella brassicaformis CCMP3155]